VESVEFATAHETNDKETAAANSTLYTLHSTLKDAVVSFNVGNIHHLDMGTLLDRLGIAVRTGHHCAQPLMDRLGISGTVRASFALYNTKEEVDALVAGIRRVSQMF
jgi:cysteine desulfurase/selenocysteine lyase